MKVKLSIIVLAFAVMMIAAVGCQSGTDGQGVEIRLAPIHEVRVNIAESYPEQIFIYIKGGLADSCTTFHDLETERCENIITITVTTQRPKDAVCAQVYGYFEKNVNLGSDFISGQTYIVDVNGVTTSFVYP